MAVSAASFRVDAGETFSLIGARAAVNRRFCACSLITARMAAAWISFGCHYAGRPLSGELRRNVQMVFQDPYASLHPNHTPVAHLAEPLQIHGIRDVAPRVTTALEQVGLAADAAPLSASALRRSTAARGHCPRPVAAPADPAAG